MESAQSWFESKGISLDMKAFESRLNDNYSQSINPITISPQSFEVVAKMLTKMEADYPGITSEIHTVGYGTSKSAVASTENMRTTPEGGSRLLLCDNFFKMMQDPDYFRERTERFAAEHSGHLLGAGLTVEDVITHEIGHSVQNMTRDFLNEDSSAGRRWGDNSVFCKAAEAAGFLETGALRAQASWSIESFISSYAMQSPLELNSEIIALSNHPEIIAALPAEGRAAIDTYKNFLNSAVGHTVIKSVDDTSSMVSCTFGLTDEFWDDFDKGLATKTIKTLIEKAQSILSKYSESQPRDSHGRFAGSGSDAEMPSYDGLMKMAPAAGPLGSQGGEWRKDEDGTKYLMKPSTSLERAQCEVAAGAVYRAAGIKFPDTAVVTSPSGRVYIVSKKIEDLSEMSPNEWTRNPETQAKAAQDFGVDALLSHWDVHGLTGDNTLIDQSGDPVRIESGGAMAYRAQGGDKPSFSEGYPWVEVESMRTSSQGRAMYGNMTDEQVAQSLERAGRIDLNAVQERWDQIGISRTTSDPWMDTLRSRQEQIPGIVMSLRGSNKSLIEALSKLREIIAMDESDFISKSGETFSPPEGVQNAAKKALQWMKDGKAGDGFTSVGRKRASDLASGKAISLETIKRMKAYFDRHQSDKDSPHWNEPSPGKVAWYAWGGDAGYSWAKRIVASQEKSDKALQAEIKKIQEQIMYDGRHIEQEKNK
jgi:hypothetical protein